MSRADRMPLRRRHDLSKFAVHRCTTSALDSDGWVARGPAGYWSWHHTWAAAWSAAVEEAEVAAGRRLINDLRKARRAQKSIR